MISVILLAISFVSPNYCYMFLSDILHTYKRSIQNEIKAYLETNKKKKLIRIMPVIFISGLALAIRHVAKCENKSHVVKEISHAFATVAKRIFLTVAIFGGNISRH